MWCLEVLGWPGNGGLRYRLDSKKRVEVMDEKLLARVSNARGVSGFEDEIQALVTDVLDDCCDETRQDPMGNVIGLKRATSVPEGALRPLRVMVSAHADEVGMMVKHITADGYIKFQPLGGLRGSTISAQQVLIYGRELVRGVVVPTENLDSQLPSLDEMYIDVGRTADEVRQVVEIGDPITFVREFERLNDKVFTGRNFDDRIGTYCLLEAMRGLGDTQVDVYAVSSVQEEMGVRGAWPAAYAIEPDIGIAVDGSVTRGPYNLVGHGDPTCEMGKGAGVYVMDGHTIGNPRLVRFLLDLGASHSIPTQRNIGGGTDAEAIQRAKAGAMATTVGAPVRYMHSTVQLCHQDDIDATVSLIRTFLEHAHELMVIDQ